MKATAIQGRDYQVAALGGVCGEFSRGRQSTLCVMPTGTGKTVTAAMMAEWAWKEHGWRTLFLAERRNLIKQAHGSLTRFGLRCAVEMGAECAKKHSARHGKPQVVIATPQTMNGERLRSWDAGEFGLIITDECHHSLAPQYRRIYQHFAESRHVGITATPGRGDGKNLGRVFQSTAYQLRLRTAIERRILVDYDEQVIPISVDLRKIKMTAGDLNVGELVERIGPKIEVLCDAVRQTVGDRQTVVFTPDQATAAAAADVLNKMGVSAKFVAGSAGKFGMSPREQRDTLNEYARLGFQVICCAELLTEGWDCTPVSCVVVMKPTRSRFKYAQMLGRGLRRCDELGKEDCLLLDFDWQTDEGCRDLASPVDLFDDGDEEMPFAVKAEAKRILKESTGKSVREAIEEAETRARTRPAVDIPLTGRVAKFEAYRRDGRGVVKILGLPSLKGYDIDYRGSNPPSDKQKQFLVSLGVEDPGNLSRYGASKIINDLKYRRSAGMASPAQVHELLCLGVAEHVARGLGAADAARAIRNHALNAQRRAFG